MTLHDRREFIKLATATLASFAAGCTPARPAPLLPAAAKCDPGPQAGWLQASHPNVRLPHLGGAPDTAVLVLDSDLGQDHLVRELSHRGASNAVIVAFNCAVDPKAQSLSDNEKVDEWKFLLGQTAPQYSYCAKQGYQLQTVNDSTTCAVFMTPSCAVCVLPDGSKTEVTKLMKLDFREKFCLNGKCCDPSTDAVCSLSPPATPTKTDWVIPVIITIGVIAAISVALLLKFRKKNTGKPE